MERSRKGYAELCGQLQKSKATEKQFHDTWAATIPEIKGLRIEIGGLKKALDGSRDANEIPQRELFTAQFGFVKKKRP